MDCSGQILVTFLITFFRFNTLVLAVVGFNSSRDCGRNLNPKAFPSLK